MALSGSFQNTFRTGYALRIEWDATQNIAANTSTVNVDLFWMSLGSSYTVNSSASKTASITIEGTTSNKGATANLADLNGNQKKLIHSYSRTVTHASNGTFSDLDLSGTFDCEVTLGSTYYSSVTVSGSAALNTIPRASTVTSSANFTAGTDFTISVSSADSSFRHIARVYVDGVQVYATPSGSKFATSVTATPTDSTVFAELAQTASKGSEIEVDTYNSSGTKIGSTTSKTGTCTAPAASTFTVPTSFNIGSTFNATITRAQSAMTHTMRIKNGSTVGQTYTGQTTSTAFDTSLVSSTLYGWIPDTNSKYVTVECTTYHSGVQVRTPTTKTILMKAITTATNPSDSGDPTGSTSADPTFTSAWTFRDGATAVTGVTGQTGNSPTIVQNLSSIIVDIPVASKATANAGATMKTYAVTLNGVTKTVPWSNTANISFTFGSATSSSATQTLTVEAIDSRGNKTSNSKTVTVVPYSNPVLTAKVVRTNGFDVETTLTSSGSISSVSVSSANKNAITKLEYRYKESTATFATPETGWVAITYTGTGMPTYTGDTVVFDTQMEQTKAYNFEIRITDKFNITTKVSKTVPVGQPMMFMDSTLKSIGIGRFPVNANTLEISGYPRIVGASTGDTNTAWMGFYESDGVTRKGWVGDGGTTHSDVTLASDVANARMQAGSTYFTVVRDTGATLNGDLIISNNPVCEVNTGSAQTIPPSAWTKLTAGTVRINQGGGTYSSGTYTVPSSGVYGVFAYTNTSTVLAKSYYLSCYVNGVLNDQNRMEQRQASNTSDGMLIAVTFVNCSAGDTLDVRYYQNDTANASITSQQLKFMKLA